VLHAPRDFFLKRRERLIPKTIKPRANRAEPTGIHAVNPARSNRTVHHETGLLQLRKMLRDRRPADRHRLSDLSYGQWPGAKPLENESARLITQANQSSFVTHG
jgi:hypothetical protein